MDRHISGTVDTPRGIVDVAVSFEEGSVRLLAGGDEVGTWDASDVDIEQSASGTVELTVDFDTLVIRPDEGTELRQIGGPSLWVSASPGVWERTERRIRAARPSRTRATRRQPCSVPCSVWCS